MNTIVVPIFSTVERNGEDVKIEIDVEIDDGDYPDVIIVGYEARILRTMEPIKLTADEEDYIVNDHNYIEDLVDRFSPVVD